MLVLFWDDRGGGLGRWRLASPISSQLQKGGQASCRNLSTDEPNGVHKENALSKLYAIFFTQNNFRTCPIQLSITT